MSVAEAFGDVATILAQLGPQTIVRLKASSPMSARVGDLIARKKDGLITTEETTELDQFLALDLLISLAKARALSPLQ